jgi:hypothetical protein
MTIPKRFRYSSDKIEAVLIEKKDIIENSL